MRIVNIEDFFHPNAGYQINIVPKYLKKFGHEVYILTSEMNKIPDNLTSFFGRDQIEDYDQQYEQLTGVKIIRLPIRAFISGRAIFTRELKKKLAELQPEVVYVHGNDTAVGMDIIWNMKHADYTVVTDSHMLEMASNNRLNKMFRHFYKTFITPRIIKAGLSVIRTQDDPYVEKCLGIPLSQAPWISYGSDTLLFHPSKQIKEQFRKDNEIPQDAFVVLYAGKLDEAKGGMLLAKAISRKLIANKTACFVIVGNTAGDYGKQVEDLFSSSENQIVRFPTQRYVDLAKFYQCADLAVFPRQCSLSFYDVQACALPVLSEDNNINIARCSHGNGWTFKQGDADALSEKLGRIVNMDNARYHEASRNALNFILENYDYEEKAREYEKIILQQVKKRLSGKIS